MPDKDEDSIFINLGDENYDINVGNNSDVYISNDVSLDLSNMGAAQATYAIDTTSIGNYTITTASTGFSNNWGNITIADWDSNQSPDIVVNDGNRGVKLLETLRSWSQALNMPMIYNAPIDNETLRGIYDKWVDAMNRGDKKACATYAKQFEMIDNLTKNDRTND